MSGFLDAHLSDEELAMLARARTFGSDVMREGADAWEAGASTVAALRLAADAGLLRLEVPHSLGGLGHRSRLKLAICEALSRVDMAFTFSLINTHNVAARLAQSTTRAYLNTLVPALQRGEIFGATALSEPNAGSDFAGIKTRATKVAGGWRLDGEKGWITNGSIADLFVTYVQTDPEAGWRGQPQRRDRAGACLPRVGTPRQAGVALPVFWLMPARKASRALHLILSRAVRPSVPAGLNSTIISSMKTTCSARRAKPSSLR